MSNTRFAYTNKLEGATLLNAPSVDASYPVANVKDDQRYTVTKTAAGPPSPVDYEWDLLSAQDVTLAAVFNISSLITSVVVESASAAGGPWTTRATLTPAGAVDKGAVFGVQNFRYWRFRANNSGLYTIGKMWLGVIQQDMGVMYSPGTLRGHRKNRAQLVSAAGLRQSFYHSRNLHQWSLLYEKMIDSQRLQLDAIFLQQKSVVFIDESDNVYEVEHADDAWGAEVVFTNLDNSRLVLEELV